MTAHPATYRPPLAWLATPAVSTLTAAMIAWAAFEDPAQTVRHTPTFLLFPLAAWVFYTRPAVVLTETGVTLRNIARTIEIPWASIQSVDTTWGLTIRTSRRPYSAWAATATSQKRAAYRTRSLMQSHPEVAYNAGGLRPAELQKSPAADAIAHLRRQWEALDDQASRNHIPPEPKIRWHYGTATLALLLFSLQLLFS